MIVQPDEFLQFLDDSLWDEELVLLKDGGEVPKEIRKVLIHKEAGVYQQLVRCQCLPQFVVFAGR